jgi:hypothetical protein
MGKLFTSTPDLIRVGEKTLKMVINPKRNCIHCGNKLCDSQEFHEQCFNCGKKPF